MIPYPQTVLKSEKVSIVKIIKNQKRTDFYKKYTTLQQIK